MEKKSRMMVADAVMSYCMMILVAVMLLSSMKEYPSYRLSWIKGEVRVEERWDCEEIYVVKQGETLNSISDKCRDPCIVENNPHIHDPDDVFPGLVIKITPSK